MGYSNSFFRQFSFAILLFQLLFLISYSQNISELIQPMCSKKQIQYTILADMMTYLDNENNIDGRELYSSIEDLKDKKLGTFSILTIDKSFKNVIQYKDYDELMSDLRKHKLDGILVDSSTANYTQSFSNDLSVIPGKAGIISPAFVAQKDSDIFQKLLEFYEKNLDNLYFIFYKWMGINDDGKFINKTLTGKNGVIKAMCINLPPFTYKDENGELIGLEVETLYEFAREYGYQLEIELKDVSSVNEIYQSLQDKSIDITSFLIQDIDVSKFSIYELDKLEIKGVIRYSNHPNSVKWTTIYDSPEQFNGENLGALIDYSFAYLYDEIFPDSELKYYKDNYGPLYDLLLEDINGFLNDDIIGKYFEKKFPDRITYYDMNVSNDLGFGFKKNEDNALLKEFNEFLATIDVEKLFEKWNVDDTFNIKVEKNNFTDGKTIKVGVRLDSKPFAYRENGEEKGFEIDLLYQFAKEQKYNVDFVELMTTSERMNLDDYDITGGAFTITEERAKNISFSDPIYKIGTALIVRTDSKKDKMKLTIYDNEYNEISDNKATINAKIGDKTVISSCAFPKTFNDTFSINCTINDLNGIDPYTQGIDYINTTDKLRIVYSDLEIDNILKANDKLKLPIIVESDKTEHICSKEEEKGLSNIGRIGLIAGGVASLVTVALLAFKICF